MVNDGPEERDSTGCKSLNEHSGRWFDSTQVHLVGKCSVLWVKDAVKGVSETIGVIVAIRAYAKPPAYPFL